MAIVATRCNFRSDRRSNVSGRGVKRSRHNDLKYISRAHNSPTIVVHLHHIGTEVTGDQEDYLRGLRRSILRRRGREIKVEEEVEEKVEEEVMEEVEEEVEEEVAK